MYQAQGGGFTYTGERFFPAGDIGNSVVGSHGGAYGTEYNSCWGANVYGIVNCRGDSEKAINTRGFGHITQMFLSFMGDGLSIDGAYYKPEGFDASLRSRRRVSATDSVLKAVLVIRADNIMPTRPHIIKNFEIFGANDCLVYVDGKSGEIGDLHIGAGVIYTDDKVRSPFYIVRPNTVGVVKINSMMFSSDITIVNDLTNVAVSYRHIEPTFFKNEHGALIKMGSKTFVYIDNDSAHKLRVYRNSGYFRVSLYTRNRGRRFYLLDALLSAQNITTDNFYNTDTYTSQKKNVNIYNSILTGTTGVEGMLNVAFDPDDHQGWLYVENRTGKAEWLIVESDQLIL